MKLYFEGDLSNLKGYDKDALDIYCWIPLFIADEILKFFKKEENGYILLKENYQLVIDKLYFLLSIEKDINLKSFMKKLWLIRFCWAGNNEWLQKEIDNLEKDTLFLANSFSFYIYEEQLIKLDKKIDTFVDILNSFDTNYKEIDAIKDTILSTMEDINTIKRFITFFENAKKQAKGEVHYQ